MANKIEVQLDLDDKTYRADLAKTEGQSKKAGKSIGSNIEKTVKGSFRNVFGSLNSSILTLGAGFAAALGGRAILQASQRQQDAVQGLNQALKSAGTFSAEASQSLQDFAAEMERTTVVGDEAVLEQLALARAFSRSNDEAAELTKAAIELSAATGIEVESAVRNLGKSFSGLLGELGELLPATRNLTQEQLKNGEALDFVLQRFGGSAAAQTKTFSGAITQLGNAFGTLLEKLGDTFTESATLRGIVSEIGVIFNELAGTIGKANVSGQFDDIVMSVLQVGAAITNVFGAPLEIAFNVLKIFFNNIRLTVQTFLVGISTATAKVVSLFAPDSDLAQSLNAFKESSRSVFGDIVDDQKEAFANLGDTSATSSLDGIIERLQNAAIQARNFKSALKPEGDQAPAGGEGNTGLLAEFEMGNLETLGFAFENFSKGISDNAEKMAANSKKAFQQIGASAISGLANSAGGAFAAFGQAIATGQDAIGAFLDSLLASFGQAAIQLGTQFILQGTAYLFAGLPNGGALIGAGAALAAFGGILSSLGGGGGAPATAGAGGGSVGAGPGGPIPVDNTQDQFPDPEDRINQGPRIAVNVQGNVLNQREFGLELIDILNNSFEADGAALA